MEHHRLHVIIFFIIGIVVGAGFYGVYLQVVEPALRPKLSLNQMYTDAIKDAMVPDLNKVYDGLTPITENNTNLIWQGTPGNESVLVVTWTKYPNSYPVGQDMNTTWGYTWVTVAPQIQTFFKIQVSPDTNLTLRADELLGLPPNCTDTYFVELWVQPQSLFRPTPNNEINDTVASFTFPSSATASYKQWFDNYLITAYYPMQYPWTRLGYTYDWGNTKTHVGLSEFVITQNSTVIVKSVTSTTEYLEGNS
jgi:hypothetical protein